MKTIKKTAVVAFTALLVQACAVSPEMAERAQRAESTVPVCEGEADCRVKWEAAQLWVVANSRYRLQVVTDVLLETYAPTDYATNLAYRVTKEPMGGGRYRLNMQGFCANLFGCTPSPVDAKLAFNFNIGRVTE